MPVITTEQMTDVHVSQIANDLVLEVGPQLASAQSTCGAWPQGQLPVDGHAITGVEFAEGS